MQVSNRKGSQNNEEIKYQENRNDQKDHQLEMLGGDEMKGSERGTVWAKISIKTVNRSKLNEH